MKMSRWTYSKANADRWLHVFDELITNGGPVKVPLEGNSRSTISLRYRIAEALKWLSDQRKVSKEYDKYYSLKRKLRYSEEGEALILQVRLPRALCSILEKEPPPSDFENITFPKENILSFMARVQNQNNDPNSRLAFARVLLNELPKYLKHQDVYGFDVPGMIIRVCECMKSINTSLAAK